LWPAPAPDAGHKAVTAAMERLVEGGVSPAMAQELAGDAVSHGLPFATPRSLKRLMRDALVRRVPVAPPRPDHAVVALVGAAGSGRTTACGRLAAAYAAGSDLEVRAIALGTPADAAELGELAGEVTRHATTPAQAAAVVAELGPRALVVLDAGPLRPRDEAGVRALRRELKAAGATEVHVVLPATLSAQAAKAVLDAARPLKPCGIVLSHADEVPAGAVVELAIASGLPITWQSAAGALGPSDVAGLAQELLP
jgi:flagellar biosynthesis GTPase FlhF